MPVTKPSYLSKTLIINLIIAVCAMFAPAAKSAIESNPEAVVMGVTIVNMLLRVVTKSKLELW